MNKKGRNKVCVEGTCCTCARRGRNKRVLRKPHIAMAESRDAIAIGHHTNSAQLHPSFMPQPLSVKIREECRRAGKSIPKIYINKNEERMTK